MVKSGSAGEETSPNLILRLIFALMVNRHLTRPVYGLENWLSWVDIGNQNRVLKRQIFTTRDILNKGLELG